MMRNGVSLAGVLLSLLLLAGCASSGSVDSIRRDLDETKTRLYTIEKDLGSARQGERDTKSDFASLRKADADFQASLDSNRSDMQALSGRVDDLGVMVKRATEEQARYQGDADRRIVALEDRIVKLQAAMDELNKRVQAGGATTAPAAQATDAQQPDSLYQQGLQAFKAGDMPTARTQLSAFIDQNPQDNLVSNARYWIGETYYSEKNYEQAILEFQEVIKKYPKKEKAPAAMLKQALAFKALKDIKSSRYVLGKLVQIYPKTDEAKKARVLLRQVR